MNALAGRRHRRHRHRRPGHRLVGTRLREYERGVVFRLGRVLGPGPGGVLAHPVRRPHGQDRPEHGHHGDPAAGGHHQATTSDEGHRGDVLPGRRSGPRGHAGRRLPAGDPPAGADHAALGAGLDRRAPGQARADQRPAAGNLDEHTEPWGVKVAAVEVKDVELPETMQRAMARQAEAERERRAKSSRPRASSRPPRSWPAAG